MNTSKLAEQVLRIFFALIFLLASNLASENESPHSYVNKVKMAAVLPLTGEAVDVGKLAQEGLLLKFEELKKLGRNYDLIVEDSRGNVNEGIKAFQSLTAKGVRIIFTALSRHGMSLKKLAEENNVLLFANTFHPEQTKNSRLVFRHNPTVDIHNEALMEPLSKHKSGSVCILYARDEWGTVSSKDLERRLRDSEIASSLEGINPRDSLERTTVLKLIKTGCSAMVTFLFGPATGLAIRYAKEQGYDGEIFSSINLAVTPSAQAAAGEYLKGTFYVVAPSSEAFSKKYFAEHKKEPPSTAESYYRALELVDFAIQQTQSSDPSVLAEFLKKVGKVTTSSGQEVLISPDGDIHLPVEVRRFE